MYVNAGGCMHLCMYDVCMYGLDVSMYIRTYVHVFVCMDVMYVCIYVFFYVVRGNLCMHACLM